MLGAVISGNTDLIIIGLAMSAFTYVHRIWQRRRLPRQPRPFARAIIVSHIRADTMLFSLGIALATFGVVKAIV